MVDLLFAFVDSLNCVICRNEVLKSVLDEDLSLARVGSDVIGELEEAGGA